MSTSAFRLRCRTCNQPVHWPPSTPRCPRPNCRGGLQPNRNIVFDASSIESAQLGMWRYRHMLPPLPDEPITLGEGGTPLLRQPESRYQLYLKNESLNPTGSYKDRGAALLINNVVDSETVIDDSSGNAGAALAAYAARGNLTARIYVPASAPKAKLDQITRYGATVIPVHGDRDAVARSADEASKHDDVFYASHVWHPGYAMAMQTIAWELWEQLGRRSPDWVLVPTGNGVLLRGLRWGFRALQKGKLIRTLPRLIAVQASNCAPLYALQQGEYSTQSFQALPTVADGVAVPTPPMLDAMWAVVQKTEGQVIAIPEEAILEARDHLSHQGFYVEPTGALAFAALSQIEHLVQPDHSIVVLLTGHGFKSS